MAGISEGSTFFDAYLKKLAIETNHVESTFLLTQGIRSFHFKSPSSLDDGLYLSVNPRPFLTWRFRRSSKLSPAKLFTRHRQDKENFERYTRRLFFQI